MFGKLSSLFGKNFAVGYFLPSFIFLVANFVLFGVPAWISSKSMADWTETDTLRATTISTIIAWFGGMVLIAFNRAILRTLEGYGALNPLRLLGWWQRRRFRKKLLRRGVLDADYTKYQKTNPTQFAKTREKRARLIRHLSERYPDDERWILPTSFGNIIRSFEIYPRAMYGADSIAIWPRLVAVVPEKTRALADDAKANVDVWANLLVLSACFAGEVLIFRQLVTDVRGIVAGCIGVALLARSRSNSAAIEWGGIIKSYFDVFLPELYRKLQFRVPTTRSEEMKIWTSFSQAAEYRDPDTMPERDYSSFPAARASEPTNRPSVGAIEPKQDEANADNDDNDNENDSDDEQE
jgi:hypothetical protein